MRKLLPDSLGAAFTPASIGDSVVVTFTYTLDYAHWDTNEIYTLAFIQDNTSKWIINSGSSLDPDWELVPLDQSFKKGQPGDMKSFHYKVFNLGGSAENFRFKMITSQPDDWNAVYVLNPEAILTLGAGITVRGKNGVLGAYANVWPWQGPGGGSLVNQGKIAPDVAGGTILISASSFQNAGSLAPGVGGTVTLVTGWTNTGTLNAGAGTINLGGTFTLAELGDFSSSGGTKPFVAEGLLTLVIPP